MPGSEGEVVFPIFWKTSACGIRRPEVPYGLTSATDTTCGELCWSSATRSCRVWKSYASGRRSKGSSQRAEGSKSLWRQIAGHHRQAPGVCPLDASLKCFSRRLCHRAFDTFDQIRELANEDSVTCLTTKRTVCIARLRSLPEMRLALFQ